MSTGPVPVITVLAVPDAAQIIITTITAIREAHTSVPTQVRPVAASAGAAAVTAGHQVVPYHVQAMEAPDADSVMNCFSKKTTHNEKNKYFRNIDNVGIGIDGTDAI